MAEKILYASAKPTQDLLGLFEYAQRLDADGLGKAEILERAEKYLIEHKGEINFKKISRTKIENTFNGVLPSSFKVRINNVELDSDVNEILKDVYNINRIMTPFKIRVVLSCYIHYLLRDKAECEVNENPSLDTLKIQAISLLLKAEEKAIIAIIEELESK